MNYIIIVNVYVCVSYNCVNNVDKQNHVILFIMFIKIGSKLLQKYFTFLCLVISLYKQVLCIFVKTA